MYEQMGIFVMSAIKQSPSVVMFTDDRYLALQWLMVVACIYDLYFSKDLHHTVSQICQSCAKSMTYWCDAEYDINIICTKAMAPPTADVSQMKEVRDLLVDIEGLEAMVAYTDACIHAIENNPFKALTERSGSSHPQLPSRML